MQKSLLTGACRLVLSLMLVSSSLQSAIAAPVPSTIRAAHALGRSVALASASGATLVSEGFSAAATGPNVWTHFGDACLTAGNAATPASSVPACKGNAPLDAVGQGALQLTAGAVNRSGMVVATTPLSTANGLQVTFTDYAYAGGASAADGLALFFSDASKPLPVPNQPFGSHLGYAGTAAIPGLANAYVGIGFDEFGNFSNPKYLTGGPGRVPESIAIRGSASTLWRYLGGVTNAAGVPASLPFTLDAPAYKTRPVTAPTVRATLTVSGLISIAIDHHDGAGFVVYHTQNIVGVAGQPAVPARVYVGLSAATGGTFFNIHQISGLVVSALSTPPVAATLQSESFTGARSTTNVWAGFGDACLTAGDAGRPAGSLPGCEQSAPADPAGGGALQLNAAGTFRSGTAISHVALPTANGLQITFTDYGFNGTSSAADGMAFFLVDASKPFPAGSANAGGSLGYANKYATPGIANAYVGVALDDYGNYSNTGDGRSDGPGIIANTIAVRGAAATGWKYLGGTNVGGKPASLPFPLSAPAALTRPAGAPTIRAILTPGGVLSVAIDRHNGAGFAAYYSQSIVGVSGQPAVPAKVYFGFSAATGGKWVHHQVSGLTIASANLPPVVTALANPPQIVSSNGSLVFNVHTQMGPAGQPQFLYNGSTSPPTLRLLPGDSLVVNLTNSLPIPPAGSGYTNFTNLHYHGLHVSPQAPGDDSIDMLAAPGQTLHYTVQIPANHPPGLYWYHTHAHGEAERQTLSGLSGALIIDGIAAYTPQVANMTERVLIARDAPLAGAILPNADLHQIYAMKWAMQHGISMHTKAGAAQRTEYHAASTQLTRNPFAIIDPNFRHFVRPLATSTHCVAGTIEAPAKALTLNGHTQPALAIAPGEQQFWRLVNAGADTYLDVQVDNTQLQIIAVDGVPISAGVGTPAMLSVSHWVLPPASRVEFIVTGPSSATPAYLRTNCFDAGSAGAAMPAAVLASLSPTVSNAARTASRYVARVSPRARDFRRSRAARIRAATVNATRTIFYSDQNTINGVAYDPAAPPQFYAQSGTVEEWTIQNNSSQVHTFHIHQVHFIVEAIDGTPQAQQFFMDNVNVPAATASGPGSVKVLLDFTDPTIVGTFLVHCHILSHEDGGMMAKIRIGTAPPLRLSANAVSFSGVHAALQTVTIAGGSAPYSVTGCGGVADAAINGSTVSIVPAAVGACVLTIADASNPSITAPISVQVNAGAPVITLKPSSVSFAAPSAAAQTVAIVGGSAPFTLSGCAGLASGTVSNGALIVSPLAAGTCSLVLTDANRNQAALSVAVNTAPGGSVLDALTFHGNSQRTGWYQHETALTTATVSAHFAQLATLSAPAGMTALGKVYAQPLYVTNETAADGKQHNLIVVASANDQVYAFDETTRAVVWHRDFTNAAAGIRQQLWSDTGCSDVNPDTGIIGTPVIDRTRNAMYVVVATMENGVPYTRLHAIGLGNGVDAIAPTTISGSVALATGGVASISSVHNMNRAALLEADGSIYVALGSHCDQAAATTHGWVLAYSAQTLQETGSLVDISNANDGSNVYLGSVWMSGFGPAADTAGNIFFATGNGPYNGSSNFGQSLLRVPGNLNLTGASSFTPIQALVDNTSDSDFGAGGVILLPDLPGSTPHTVFTGGKCSANNVGCIKYLLNRDALGGQQARNAGALWTASISGAMLGGAAYFADAAGGQHLVFGTGQPISTYTVGVNPVGLTVQSSANVGCLECRDSGSQPIVSSNGTQAGSAVVWALKTPGEAGGTITLYAFNALNMAQTLFAGNAGPWTQAPGTSHSSAALVSPLVANGRVYVPVEGGVTVFGLH